MVAFFANDSSDELRQAAHLRTGEYSVVSSSTKRLLLERSTLRVGLVAAAFALFSWTSAVVIRVLGLSEKRQMATNPLIQLEFCS